MSFGYNTINMPSQDAYFGQNDPLAGVDLENLDFTMDSDGAEFEGVDFGSFPLPDIPDFDVNQPPYEIPAHRDVAGDDSDVLESNIDPVLRDLSTQLDTVGQPVLDPPQLDLNLLSNEDFATSLDVAGDISNGVEPDFNSLPLGSSTQIGNVDFSTDHQIAPMPYFQADPTLASLATNYAFDTYDPGEELAIAAWNPAPPIPPVPLYPQPPSPTKIVTKRHSRQLTKRKQDRTTPYQPSKRRPTIPDHFLAHIDVENPPRRESEVHDVKGCKDTTLANEYYYRINSLPPLKNFFGKGSDITYQGPEFHKNVEFTGAEFMRYLRTSDRTPVLIVQLQPQKCNHRYIRGGQSFKCRNKNCPDPKKTIWKGHFRVCITEFYDAEGHWVNPFQSAAGYLHLYCLEHMLDLSEVVADAPISVCPEGRNFKHEPGNPMELSKPEQRTYEKWVEEFGPRWVAHREQQSRAKVPRDQWPALAVAEEDRLYHRLTAAHLKKNPGTVKMAQKRRAKAGDKKITAHVDQVLGDVGMHVAVMKRRRNAYAAGMDEEEEKDNEPSKPAASKRRRISSSASHSYNLRSATPRRAGPGQEPASQPKAANRHSPRQQPKNRNSTGLNLSPPPLPQAQPPLTGTPTTTLPPGTEQPPLQFDTDDPPAFFDINSVTMGPQPALDDDAQLYALLGLSPARPGSSSYSYPPPPPTPTTTVPGDSSVVEQSIVVQTTTTSAVPVPALTSPPRTSRRRRYSSLAAHKVSLGGVLKSPGARQVRVAG